MFTPIESSLGALLIQAATTSYMQLEGKAIGFSSILYNSIFRPSVHSVSIIAGLFLSSKFISTVLPTFAPTIIPALSKTVSSFYGSPLNFLTAGLIVGFGTSAGCGCTSGHMLIGLSRLRWRSFVATCTFFITAVITTMVSGNYNQINTSTTPSYYYDSNFTQVKDNLYPLLALVLGGQLWSYIILPKIGSWLKEVKHQDQLVRAITGISAGFLFGCGLFIAGMTDPTKVTGFLSFLTPHNFDPSLAMIPVFCILPNIFIWRKTTPQTKAEAIEIVAKDSTNNEEPTVVQKPLFESEYDLNFCDQADLKFLIGNALFGIGWGLAGVCPGPGILAMSSEIFAATIGRGCLFIGAFLAGSYTEKHINLL
jgi:uncharacterized membrane protein YedE/YeeE